MPLLIVLMVLPAMGQAQTTRPESAKPLWIAVAAPGLVKTIEPLARRRAGEGFEIQILDDTKLRTERQRADRNVEPIRKAIRDAMRAERFSGSAVSRSISAPANARLVCVVLVGFDPGLRTGGTLRAGAPPDAFALPGGKGSADNMVGRPSDAVIGDLNGDGRVAVSLGRLPARSATELEQMIDKIIRFESQAEPAEWHHRFLLLGGAPNYGMLIDRLIERFAGLALDRLDGRWLGTVFYDQPNSQLSLPPDKLAAAALAAMGQGAAITVYVGHSSPEGFFLDRGMLEKVRLPIGAGPLISLSCLGGVQATGGDGFAVAAMRNKDGPVATFAAAHISYPQWNKLLAEGLEKSFFNRAASGPAGPSAASVPRLAGVIDGMRENLAVGRLDLVTLVALNLVDGSDQDYAAQRIGQSQMYSLFGDPATRLPWLVSELTLTGPARAGAGQVVRLVGRLADHTMDGATVQVLIRRQFQAIPPGPAGESDLARHARINRLELVTGQAVVAGNDFQVELRLPGPSGQTGQMSGDCLIARAWAIGKGPQQAIGWCRIELEGNGGKLRRFVPTPLDLLKN